MEAVAKFQTVVEPVAPETRRRAGFRQADLTRAIKAATRAGLQVVTARISRDGCIELAFGTANGVHCSGANPWDRQ